MAEDADTRNLDSTGGGGLGDGSGVVAGPPDGSGMDNNAPGGLQTGDARQGSGAAGFFAWSEALWSGRFGSPPLDPFVIYPGGVDSTGRFHGTYGFGEVTLLDQGLAAFFGPVGSRQSPADQYFELTGRRDFGRTTLLDSPDLMAQNVPAGAQVPSGFGEIFIDTDPGGLHGYWANKLGLTADDLRRAAEMGLTAEDLRLAENITVVAPRNDVVSPGKDPAPTTSPMGPPPPSAPPTSDPASSPLPPISVAPPGAGSGGPGPSPVRERGYSIEPLPPISGSNDALLFNPTASYWKYWRDRGRQAERKANPDVRDLHDIYEGKLAAPLAALEDLVIGIFNVPHGIVNHGINGGQHLGRSYLLASERGEYAEAYAEYLDAFIDLSVGFLDLASLGESGSVGKRPDASLAPAVGDSLPTARSAALPATEAAALFNARNEAVRVADSLLSQEVAAGQVAPNKIATRYGVVADAVFKANVRQAVAEGTLPSTFVTSPTVRLNSGFPRNWFSTTDVWDTATGRSWDLQTPNTSYFYKHEGKYLGSVTPDGTVITEVNPLFYSRGNGL